MKAGFAKQIVTPRAGVPMEGLSQKVPSASVHDDLYVRVLFLQHGKQTQVIISFDLLFMERFQVDRIKGAISNLTGLSSAEVLVNFTHTHAGPRITRWAYSEGPEVAYIDYLEVAACNAVLAARGEVVEVTLEAGCTNTDLPVNRRLLNSEGKAEWRVNRDGPVVNDLPFCIFRAVDSSSVVAALFSVACHPSMMHEPVISAEFPGAAVKKLNESLRTEGAIFLQGAAGDAKPRPAAGDTWWGKSTWEQMSEVGEHLAHLVVEGGKSSRRVVPALQTELVEVLWRLLPPPSRVELAELLASSSTEANRKAWARDMLAILDLLGDLPSAVGVLLQVITLGEDLRIVAIEGEVLARLGQRLLAVMPPGINFLLGYSNGCALYLPDRCDVSAGGYEVDSFWEYHRASGPAPDCDEPLVEAVRVLCSRASGEKPQPDYKK